MVALIYSRLSNKPNDIFVAILIMVSFPAGLTVIMSRFEELNLIKEKERPSRGVT